MLDSSAPRAGGNSRSIAGEVLDWGRDKGWYVDLNPANASAGERVNVDMQVELGMLKAVGNAYAATLGINRHRFWHVVEVFLTMPAKQKP